MEYNKYTNSYTYTPKETKGIYRRAAESFERLAKALRNLTNGVDGL